MKNIGTLLFAACVGLVGCASTPIPAEKAKPAERVSGYQTPPAGEYGNLIVTRDEGIYGSGCSMVVSIDNKEVARLWAGETARFYKEPGKFFISVVSSPVICPGGIRERQSELKAGETQRFRIMLDTQSYDIFPTGY